MRLRGIVALLLVFTGCGKPAPEEFAGGIERIVSSTPGWVESSELGKRVWDLTRKAYADRQHRPFWLDGDVPTPQFDELIQALDEAASHGLEAARYGGAQLRADRDLAEAAWLGARFDHERVAEVDVRSTFAFLLYGADLLGWRFNSRDVDREWLSRVEKQDLTAELDRALQQGSVKQTLQAFAPSHEQYRGLRAALMRADNAVGTSGSAPLRDWDRERIRMNL